MFDGRVALSPVRMRTDGSVRTAARLLPKGIREHEREAMPPGHRRFSILPSRRGPGVEGYQCSDRRQWIRQVQLPELLPDAQLYDAREPAGVCRPEGWGEFASTFRSQAHPGDERNTRVCG